MTDLDLRSLEIFRTVAREGSVSVAGEKLNRVQSNISTRIRQLEERLGKTLFRRAGRGLSLTAEGERLLPFAERLLDLSREASEAMRDDRPAGRLRIGAMESTAAARLPAILDRYRRTHADVTMELETGTAGHILQRLNGYHIDCAFIAEPVKADGLETRPVFRESLVLIAPNGFPALNDPSALNGRTMIAFETGCAYRRYLEDWLFETRITPATVLAVNSYLAILACVTAGTGFAVLPRSVLDLVPGMSGFQTRPLEGAMADIETLLVWRQGFESANLTALKALLPAPENTVLTRN